MADSADPFDTLKDVDAHDAGAPLPAAEVRARGDRMRRRRTTFRAVVAAAAVAVVTTGGVALGGQLSGAPAPLPPATQAPSSSPTPTERPSVTESDPPEQTVDWVTEIPEDFPLALGYPADDSEDTNLLGPAEDVPVLTGLRVCGEVRQGVTQQTDRLAVSFTQPEDTRARALTLHGTDRAAQDQLRRLVDLMRSCPRHENDFDGATLTQVREVEPGVEGFVAIHTYEQGNRPVIGLELIYVVRVGNAVLLQSAANEGGGNEKQIYAQVRDQTQVVAELAEAMCIFSPDGCPSPGRVDPSETAEEEAAEAAEDAARATFGPAGFGGVQLGMTGAEMEASGRVTLEHLTRTGCVDFGLLSPDRSDVIGGGYLSEGNGVEVLMLDVNGAPDRARTPEGITPESTLEEVRTAYPDGEWFDPTYVTPVPGFDDRQYSFTFAGGEATGILSMGVHLRTQSCAPNLSGTSYAP